MPDITETPEFEEWLDRMIDRFPAPSPEVARRLVDLLGPEHGDGPASDESTGN